MNSWNEFEPPPFQRPSISLVFQNVGTSGISTQFAGVGEVGIQPAESRTFFGGRTTEISFLPEKQTPILETDGEVSVPGRGAAPDTISYGQNISESLSGMPTRSSVSTPLGDDYLTMLA